MAIKEIKFQTRDEWLTHRKQGIGGSDIAALMGISPYKTPLQVYLDKVAEIDPDEQFLIQEDNQRTRMGHILEPIIANLFKDHTGMDIKRYDDVIFMNDKYPLLLGSFDGKVFQDGEEVAILECKNVGGFGTKLWTAGVPPYYMAQVQHYMTVADLPKAYVAALFDGWDFQIYEVERDEKFIQTMLKTVDMFWEFHVQEKTPPEPKTAADIKALFSTSNPGKVKACTYARKLDLIQLQETQEELKRLKALEDGLKTKIQAYMEDAEILEDEEDGKLLATWKSSKPSKTFDTKRFEKENETLYQDYLKETPGVRRFIIKL